MASSRTLLLLRKAFLLAAIVLACCVTVSVVGPQNSTTTTASSIGTSFNPPEDHRGHQQGLWPEGEGQRRSLVTGGVPGEGLLLVVANSDADAIDEFGDEGIEFPPPEERGWHKKLLPPNKWDVATVILASFGLMIAAAGGIGGGGILVPIFILVLRFGPKYAVPLSNITIFGGAITNTFLNMKKRHPLADRPLVDWDLILVMEPLTIGGALVGSFIQKVLPEVVLTLSMVLLLVATADRTFRKGLKAFKKESSLQAKELGGTADAKVSSAAAISNDKSHTTLLGNGTKSYGAANGVEDGKGTFTTAVLAPSSSPAAIAAGDVETPEEAMMIPTTAPVSPAETSGLSPSEKADALQLLLDEEQHTSLAKVGIMTAVFVVLLTVNLLKGGGAFDSPVGIVCGSFSFWATSVLSFVYLVGVSLYVRRYLVNRWVLKAEVGFEYVEGDVEWTPLNTIRYPCICFFAGFFAGMFGVGGGIVKGPLMLEMALELAEPLSERTIKCNMVCGDFCRQFGALVRKNFLAKRRSKLQLAIELIVPALVMLLIGVIKNSISPKELPAGTPATDTPVVTYEALQNTTVSPNVLCYDNNVFHRCGCHRSTDDYEPPESYVSGAAITFTAAAIWATQHDSDTLLSHCQLALGAVASLTDDALCTGTKFIRLMCDSDEFRMLGLVLDEAPEIDESCGDGTTDSLDTSGQGYVTVMQDAVALMAADSDLSIPAAEIDSVCERLTFAVMPADDGAAADEAADFYDYVTEAFPDTQSHWISYDSESEFLDIIGEGDYSQDAFDDRPAFVAGIVFTSGSPDWAYTIRANITKSGTDSDSYYMFNVPETESPTENNCKSPTDCPEDDEGRENFSWAALYHQSHVLMLQQLVDNRIMSIEGSTATPPVVRITEFPNAAYEEDGFWSQVGAMFAILVVIAVLYPIANVISALVKEKELRIKEGLKMMGLTDAAHTASWVFHFVCLFFFTSLIMVLASGSLFEFSDPVLVFIYFFLFFMASTAFCFFISAFFSRAKTASTIGTMLFFVALFPYFSVQSDDTSADDRRLACLLPPTCLALGTVAFSEFEDSGEGVTADTAGESEDGFTFNDVLGMLFLDILIFSALAWYAGHVLPSEWGTAKKPWFFLTANYWCPGKGTESALKDNLQELEHFESEGRDSVEPVEDELRSQVAAGECVAIRGLTKEYKNSTGGSKLAVDKLDLTMYSGQITALLGHNGAGKTTTIGMLTGMIPVTSGSAFVAGRDVNTDMVSIRNSLGVCPQHDILYPDLTVREHLRMYAVLKSVPSSELQEAITNTLNDVGLTEKENELTTTLSGGQKRKLSVGIALIGGSKVVFLDEPTSGMDPHSRRFTWDLIRKNREGRVIVLTTHFMDEADLLGDRVAIMADGALRCCGSSIFLKNHYGVGYNLTIVREIQGAESDMKPAFESGTSAEGKIDEDIGVNNTAAQEAGVKPIKRLVRSHVKAATLLSNVGAEVSFQLPNDASPSFQGMLTEIDSRKAELGVNSYGLSVTTLEEVFLRVANGTADVEARKEIAGISMMRQSSYSSTMMEAATTKMAANVVGGGGKEDLGIDRSKPLFGRHMMALLKKRLLTFKRDKKMWAFVVLMPAFFVLIGVLILLAVAATNEPSMLLTPEDYNDGSAPFPYATECAATATATCDPEVLVAEMDISGSAEPVVLGIPATADESGAVELMSEALLEGEYEDNVYGAVSFREADSSTETYDFTVHANYSALHSAPLYVNQINTALLRLVTGNSDLSIAVTMHPLPRTPREEDIDSGFNSFNVSLFMLIAFSFVPAAWMAYIVREKETKCKHQQVVSGVGLEAYWLSSFLWDYVSLIPPVAFTLIVLAAADVKALISGENGVATFLLFLLFGFSMPCYTYLWSFLFKNYSKAQNAFLFHNWITGLILPIATTIMSLFEGAVSDVGRGMAAVLRIVPSFALGDGLMNMSFMEFFGFLDDKDYTALSMRITGNALLYMAICGVIFLGLLLVTERASAGGSALSGLCGRLSVGRSLGKLTPRQLGDEDEIDEDVRAEMDRVAGGGADNDVVKVKGLRKVYPASGGAKVAVKSTSLGIPRGECFGLLGINGAGKSSTLAILSGELPPTTGSAYLSGFDVGKNPEEIHRLVGYCPQFDALFETLTGREHLALYASIKGIPADKRSAAVDQKIEEMGLKQYADRPAGGYSGGNKRKLSVAMAMIGDPQIVFLDEPSTGMDPMARRFMWNVIMRIVTENKECAMILTTHSMEECEALCQRIGIMVGGRLRCLGTSQHLKTRFGKGFQLEARVKAITHEETDAMMATLAHATNGQGTLTNDGGVLRAALAAAQAPELEAEVSPTGRGASIYHAIANQGGVSVRDLAAWICVEKKCSRVIAFMQQHFAGAALREKQNAKMRFEFPPQKNQTLAQMFGFIENERDSLFIGEYALSQTSLEQVFNGFAAQQEEELGHAAGTM